MARQGEARGYRGVMTVWAARAGLAVAAFAFMLLDLSMGVTGQGARQDGREGIVWAGGGHGYGYKERNSKWSYKMTETRRYPSLPRAGPALRPGVAGASGGHGYRHRHGHDRIHAGVPRGSRPGYGVFRGGENRGRDKEKDRRPHHGRRGKASSTLGITKYTDKYKTWRGLVHGESVL